MFKLHKEVKKQTAKITSPTIKNFSGFAKAILLILCLFYIYSTIKELKNQEIEKVSNTYNAISRTISSNVDYTSYQIYYIAKQLGKTGGNEQKIKYILSSYQTNINDGFDVVTSWNMYSWINKKGELSVDGFEGILKKPIDLSHRDYLPITKNRPGKVIVGKPILGAISNRLIIPIAVGVSDDNDNYVGTVVFGIDIGKLVTKIEISSRDNPLQFFILDKNRNLIFKSSILSNKKIKIILDQVSEENGLEGFLTQNSIKNLTNTLFSKIDVANEISSQSGEIYLGVVNNDALLNANLSGLVTQKVLIFLVTVLFLALILAKIYYRVIKPLNILCNYANDITNNKRHPISFEDIGVEDFKDLYLALSSIDRHVEIERSLKKQLQITNSHLKNLTKSINHDLRNYISGISGLAKMLIDINKRQDLRNKLENNKTSFQNDAPAKEIDKYAKMIVSQADITLKFSKALISDEGINSAVDKVINNEKLTQNEEPEINWFGNEDNLEEINIDQMIRELVLLSLPFIKEHKVEVKFDFEPHLPKLETSRIEMRKIFDNLIINAVKYSNKDGEVVILAKNINNKIYIEIIDNGIGMNDEEISQALLGAGKGIDKSNLDKSFDSHGIGLPIVKKAVENLGAKMKIESKKGRGTKVRLWFDVNDKNNFEDNISYLGGEKIRNILFVDDDQIMRLMLNQQLKNLGFQVSLAKNGKEALAMLDDDNENNFDLIIMDTNIDKLGDGFEISRTIREGLIFKNFKKFKTIPIIAFSANSDEISKNIASQSGMNDYLEKPFDQEKFSNILLKLTFN